MSKISCVLKCCLLWVCSQGYYNKQRSEHRAQPRVSPQCGSGRIGNLFKCTSLLIVVGNVNPLFMMRKPVPVLCRSPGKSKFTLRFTHDIILYDGMDYRFLQMFKCVKICFQSPLCKHWCQMKSGQEVKVCHQLFVSGTIFMNINTDRR